MSQQLYARLGRFTYKSISPFLRLYMGKKHHRVRILLINPQQEVLLVRSWLGHQLWSLPGGGIQRNEDLRKTAVRELHEETGIVVPLQSVKPLAEFTNPYKTAPFKISCFVASTSGKQPVRTGYRKLEVLDAAWFSVNKLPNNCSPTVRKALHFYSDKP